MRDLIVAAVIAVTAFGAAWKIQDWRYGDQIATMKAKASEDTKTALKAAIAIERSNQARKDEAINEANKRAQQNALAASASRNAADSLRKQLNSARASLPQATCEATRNYAAAVSEVFGSCVQEYRELAEKADGHASDAMTLDQAWPQP